jgi:hypothetical protein
MLKLAAHSCAFGAICCAGRNMFPRAQMRGKLEKTKDKDVMTRLKDAQTAR